MWNTATISEILADAKEYGFSCDNLNFDWKTIKEKRDAYIVRLNGIYKNNLANSGVTVFNGYGKYIAPNTIQAGDQVIKGKHTLIATGGRPTNPEVPGIEHTITRSLF